MKNILLGFILSLCLALFGQAFAEDSAAPAKPATTGEVKLKLLGQLEADGYLSQKLADEARIKYVTPTDLTMPVSASAPAAEPSLWDRVMTWTNLFYVLGVIVLLVAFAGWIASLAALCMSVLLAIPKEVHQGVLLSASATMTLNRFIPALNGLAEHHSFYVALFGSLASLVVAHWTLETHPRFANLARKLLAVGLPNDLAIAFWLMVYFGALALGYHSEMFGFLAAVAFSGMLSFSIGYRPGVLWMDFENKALPAVVFGNLGALLLYTGLKLTGHLPAEATLFEVGLTYYCTIAMGVGFLVGASPFAWRQSKSPIGYLVLFLVTLLAALAAYVFFDFKVVGSILSVFAVLLALEWHAKLCMQAGFVFGMFLLGSALVGLSTMMERHGHLLVLYVANQ